MTQDQLLQRNLRVYAWVRMLTMRVYLPLTAIYLAEVGHLTIQQLGLLVTIASVTSVVSNVPTGYLADKWTRKSALMLGALLLCLASSLYAAFPQLLGACTAAVIEALGYSVIAGAGEALIHDTLVYQKRAHDYIKTVGRAQSKALVGNIILVGLVPLSYGINKHLPFVFGALAAGIFFLLASRMVEPPRPERPTTEQPYNLYRVLRVFVNKNTILFFLAVGLLSNAYRSLPPITNLAIKDMGLSPALFGIAFSVGSLVGAINGHFLHLFKRIKLESYVILDVILCVSYPLVIALTRNLWLSLLLFVIDMGFWRMRGILYQSQLLKRYPHHHFKATLISTLSLFDNMHAWQPLVFAGVVGTYGYYRGLGYLGAAIFVVMSVFLIIAVRVLGPEPSDIDGNLTKV